MTHNYEGMGGDVFDRLTLEYLMAKLDPEEQEILHLWVIRELNFTEIGKIIGLKYRGRELTGSAIRYHKEKILARLAEYRPICDV
jgi:DNA-directed RNA polymerase specialized sigma subunit